MRRAANPDLIADVTDGEAWASIVDGDPVFASDPRNVAFTMAFDPFQVDKDDAKSSVSPLMAVPANVRDHLRQKLGAAKVLCIAPGSREDDVKACPDDMLAIAVDELLHLDRTGARVYDSWTRTSFMCRARLLQMIGDYRGLMKLLKIPQSPALVACPKCWNMGFKTCARGKTIYPGASGLLPLDHPLRAAAQHLNRNGATGLVVAPRQRSNYEVATASPTPLVHPESSDPALRIPVPARTASVRREISVLPARRGGRPPRPPAAGVAAPAPPTQPAAGAGTAAAAGFGGGLIADLGPNAQGAGELAGAHAGVEDEPAADDDEAEFELKNDEEADGEQGLAGAAPPDIERPSCALFDLHYFPARLCIHPDPMHTIAGVIKDTVVRGLQPQQRISEAILLYEAQANSRYEDSVVPSIAARPARPATHARGPRPAGRRSPGCGGRQPAQPPDECQQAVQGCRLLQDGGAVRGLCAQPSRRPATDPTGRLH